MTNVVGSSLVLAVALGASVLLQTPASASSVTSVTFTASSTQGDATDLLAAHFTPATALAAGDTVTITFPTDFAVAASPSLTFGGNFTGCSTSSTATGTSGQVVVTLAGTSCALAANAAGSIAFDVTNPPAPKTYITSAFTVKTSVDATVAPATSAPTTISGSNTPVQVTSFTPITGELYGNEVATWQFAFTPQNMLATGDTVTLTFPSTVVLPTTIAVSNASSFGASCSMSAPSPSADTITVTLGASCSLGTTSIGQFEIAGIQNPPNGDSGFSTDYSISTSEDLIAANPTSGPAIVASGTESPDNDTITVQSFGPASSTAGASTTWDLTFTTSQYGALYGGDEVFFNFPTSVAITSGESATLGGGFSGTCTGATIVEQTPPPSSSSIIYVVAVPAGCTLTDSTQGSVSFAVTNPPAGTYPGGDFAVGTSEDTTGPFLSSVVIQGVAAFTLSVTDTTSGTSTITYGDSLTLTLSDTTDSPTPTGNVDIAYTTDGTTFVFPPGCSNLSLSSGSASCTVTGLPATSNLHFAYTYAGDSSYVAVSTTTEVGSTYTIDPATLRVIAVSQILREGTPFSPVTSISNAVSGGTATPTSLAFTFAGTNGTVYGPSTAPPTAAGTYSVTPSAATLSVSPGTMADYVISYVAGTLTIFPPPPVGGSGSSSTTTPQVTLSVSLTSATGTVGSPVDLSSLGGSGSGAVTYSVVGGTAPDCAISGTTLTAMGPGTCVVEATKAGDATYASTTSAPVAITFDAAKVVRHHPIAVSHPVVVAFAPGASTLSPATRRSLIALVKHLHPGATLTVTTWGEPRSLALARARAIDAFLTHYRHLHVRVFAIVSVLNRVRVVTTRQ